MIRQKSGFERVLIFLTGLRQYRCQDCDQRFRAPDRRFRPRHPHVARSSAVSKPAPSPEFLLR
jgi:hypothetical protein